MNALSLKTWQKKDHSQVTVSEHEIDLKLSGEAGMGIGLLSSQSKRSGGRLLSLAIFCSLLLGPGLLTSAKGQVAVEDTQLTLPGQTKGQPSIIPEPDDVQTRNGHFIIGPTTRIQYDDKTALSASYLTHYLKQYYNFDLEKLGVASAHQGRKHHLSGNVIVLALRKNDPSLDTTIGSYSLVCDKGRLEITSSNAEGVFYGIQTLIQLLPIPLSDAMNNKNQGTTLAIQNIQVKDAPRFGYRGMMLDVGRNFMPVSFVKEFIDYLALHKMNIFHWHLTEDQGWRIEIKKYPRLTEVGAWRNGSIKGHYPDSKDNDCIRTGGFYTQQEIKDVVKYAADRYITVVPEIELPGHSSAAIAAYPELSCFPDSATEHKLTWCGPDTGKQVQQTWGVFKDVYAPTPYTFHFIENVLDEVLTLFPSPYIHIGGDECPKTYWKESPYCQQLIKEKGLKDEEGLQSYFIGKIDRYLSSKGRKMIGWDEILQGGLTPGATVQSWRGEQGGVKAASLQHNVIMSPMNSLYLTRSQKEQEDSLIVGGKLLLSKIYSYDPIGKIEPGYQHYVIGAEATIWTEYMKNPAKVQYMIFPRMAAVSEVFWTAAKDKNYADFLRRLKTQIDRYKLWGVNYSKNFITK